MGKSKRVTEEKDEGKAIRIAKTGWNAVKCNVNRFTKDSYATLPSNFSEGELRGLFRELKYDYFDFGDDESGIAERNKITIGEYMDFHKDFLKTFQYATSRKELVTSAVKKVHNDQVARFIKSVKHDVEFKKEQEKHYDLRVSSDYFSPDTSRLLLPENFRLQKDSSFEEALYIEALMFLEPMIDRGNTFPENAAPDKGVPGPKEKKLRSVQGATYDFRGYTGFDTEAKRQLYFTELATSAVKLLPGIQKVKSRTPSLITYGPDSKIFTQWYLSSIGNFFSSGQLMYFKTRIAEDPEPEPEDVFEDYSSYSSLIPSNPRDGSFNYKEYKAEKKDMHVRFRAAWDLKQNEKRALKAYEAFKINWETHKVTLKLTPSIGKNSVYKWDDNSLLPSCSEIGQFAYSKDKYAAKEDNLPQYDIHYHNTRMDPHNIAEVREYVQKIPLNVFKDYKKDLQQFIQDYNNIRRIWYNVDPIQVEKTKNENHNPTARNKIANASQLAVYISYHPFMLAQALHLSGHPYQMSQANWWIAKVIVSDIAITKEFVGLVEQGMTVYEWPAFALRALRRSAAEYENREEWIAEHRYKFNGRNGEDFKYILELLESKELDKVMAREVFLPYIGEQQELPESVTRGTWVNAPKKVLKKRAPERSQKFEANLPSPKKQKPQEQPKPKARLRVEPYKFKRMSRMKPE
ncbi:uncharacterized protein LOC134815114 [Bolinopsis microptera]|uniref:uncharacterized protein LOC134815114 n=1 Tax=Bolinopsis microptera TaxID=2820187 RepID=UPI003079A17C